MIENICTWIQQLDSNALAAWIQAIGSIITIIWAVWISRAEIRRDNKQKLIAARVIATDWLTVLAGAPTVIKILNEQVKATFFPRSLNPEYRALCIENITRKIESNFEYIDRICTWNTDDILRLMPLGCVSMLYEGKRFFLSAKTHAQVVMKEKEFFENEIRNTAHVNGISDSLEHADHRLTEAIKILENAERDFKKERNIHKFKKFLKGVLCSD